ncbi:MAG: hypothetical protein K2P64_10700, partial [Lachnospiraceae bacterium]|nr:hypothetical protein [Lachnospiraceae bacterium]
LCGRYRPHKDKGSLKSRLADLQEAFEGVMACLAGAGPGTDEEKETLVKKCVGLTMECIRAHIFAAGKMQDLKQQMQKQQEQKQQGQEQQEQQKLQKQEGGIAQICSQS